MSKLRWFLLLVLFLENAGAMAAKELVEEFQDQKSGGEPLDFSHVKSLYEYIHMQKKSQSRGEAVAGTIGIFGGFGTCTNKGPYGVEIYERALQLLYERAAEGIYFRVVASCFGTSNKTTYFFGSSDVDSIYYGNYLDVERQVEKEVNLTKSRRLFLMGHSYGGWLSIQSGMALGSTVKLQGIVTIDPISRVYCSPTTFINAYLSSMFSFNPSPDCTQPPRDISLEVANSLRKNSKWWYNFFQDNSGYVHSGIINAARNFHVEYDFTNIWDFARAHMDIDNDERVWSTFEHLVR